MIEKLTYVVLIIILVLGVLFNEISATTAIILLIIIDFVYDTLS